MKNQYMDKQNWNEQIMKLFYFYTGKKSEYSILNIASLTETSFSFTEHFPCVV